MTATTRMAGEYDDSSLAGETPAPRVHVASDILLYREGLTSVLEKDGRLEVVSSSIDVAGASSSLDGASIDAVLLDTGMDGALGLVKAMQSSDQHPAVVALGLHDSESDILPYLEMGISAYVCREGTVSDVVQAVFCALNDELICSRQIAAALQRKVTRLAGEPAEPNPSLTLTRREQQIAKSLELGLSNKQIATSLHISVSTVKNHVHNVLEKLQVNTRLEAAARLRQGGSAASSSITDGDTPGI